ncbi:MAG: hypothetical protein RR436_02690 [Clostridia bacterium]
MDNYEQVEVTSIPSNEGPTVINRTIKQTVKTGISFGSVLAMIISYHSLASIPWAIIHGLLGWIYVIYFLIFK